MKAGRLIEVLKKVSPDAEVRCGIGNVPTLMITNLLNLKRIPKYEVKSVLTKPDDDKYCTLLIKRNGGIKMRFKKLSEYDEELKSSYPDMNDDTVLYQIIFELPEFPWELF